MTSCLNNFEWLPLGRGITGEVPSPRWGQSASALDDGSVLFLGGADFFGGASTDVFHFSEDNGWVRAASRNCPPLAAHSAEVVGNRIWCFGGDGRGLSVDTWVLDLTSMSWTNMLVKGQPPAWRRTHGSAAIGDAVYIIGGWGEGGPLNDVHVLETSEEEGSASWRQIHFAAREATPPQRASHSATAMRLAGQQRILVYGGWNGHQQLRDFWSLDITSQQPVWHCPQTFGSAPPCGRSGHSATMVGSDLVLLGGEKELRETFFHDVYVLNTDTMMWSVAQVSGSTPEGRGWHTATLLSPGAAFVSSSGGSISTESRILVFGGGRYSKFFNDVHILDLAAGGASPVPPDDLASDMGRLLSRTDLADVTFAFDGGLEQLHAHSQVLCARSSLFDAMLTNKSQWAEGAQSAIPVDDVPVASFRKFLEYLYTGACSWSNDTDGATADEDSVGLDSDVRCALDLMPLSAMHMLPRLQAQCVSVLGRALKQRARGLGVHSPAFKELLAVAELHNLTTLQNLAQELQRTSASK